MTYRYHLRHREGGFVDHPGTEQTFGDDIPILAPYFFAAAHNNCVLQLQRHKWPALMFGLPMNRHNLPR